MQENYIYRFVVLGNQGVGKTSLIHRFISNTFNHNGHEVTVGLSYSMKTIVSGGTKAV